MAQTRPLPRICIALGLPDVATLLEHAKREAEAGEAFLEFRLDFLADPCKGAEAIAGFLDQFPDCTILATCRRHQNHGKFNGSMEEQLAILDVAVRSGAQSVDIEIETAEIAHDRLSQFRGRAQVVLSYHNYEATPPMDTIVARMLQVPADAYKIVTTARKPSDNIRVLSAAKGLPKQHMIVLAMGELGFPDARALPGFRRRLHLRRAHAEPWHRCRTGQRAYLRHLYRVEKLARDRAHLRGHCRPGPPLDLARGPQSRFSVAAGGCRLSSLPGFAGFLRDFFSLADKLPLAGFSVTIPHKQKIIRYLDAVEPLARRIGAVNTVWRKAGKWRGTNTDAAGVTGPLARLIRLNKSNILIVGNGGAARGAAFALSDAGAKISLVGRNADRVRALAKVCGAEALMREQLSSLHFDAVVHATPLGMYPHVNDCFFAGDIPADVVFDMVYNPLETQLLKRAREQGKTVIPGLEMFIEQAARQFELWTGESAPRPVMQKAALEALNGNHNHHK